MFDARSLLAASTNSVGSSVMMLFPCDVSQVHVNRQGIISQSPRGNAEAMSNVKQSRTDPAMVALIAAILDPDEVRKTEPTNEIPNCLLAAVDLVGKAQKLIDGTVTPEQLSSEWRERLRQTDLIDKIEMRAKWKLEGPEQYTLSEAVHSDWCTGFKSETKLKAFLKRVEFPFHLFGRKVNFNHTCDL
jgi:hypothetical protein